MITVSTAELKTHLGRYLRLVRKGESISVTSHRHPIAQLIPSSSENDVEVIEPTRSIEILRDLTAVPLGQPVEGVEALLADRSRR